MNRNPEVLKETIIYSLITIIIAFITLLVSSVGAMFVLINGLMMIAAHYYFANIRYKKIANLSETLNRILLGQETVLINDCNEGELAILNSEIHKMTSRLKEQTDLLLKDKKNLTMAIEDIFHQLRTPLTAMSLNITLLCDENLTFEKRIRLTHDLKKQVAKISWLVDSLLKMSKIDSQSAVFENEEVIVKQLLKQAAEPLLIQMELKDVAFKISCNDESFLGDMKWSVEAFGNLIKNAVEHTPTDGAINVSAIETPLYTEIRISDTGEGFYKEDMPYLFDRFYKGKNASDSSIGIGLALSRAIIVNQNGIITAKNKADGGAEFIVKFYKSII